MSITNSFYFSLTCIEHVILHNLSWGMTQDQGLFACVDSYDLGEEASTPFPELSPFSFQAKILRAQHKRPAFYQPASTQDVEVLSKAFNDKARPLEKALAPCDFFDEIVEFQMPHTIKVAILSDGLEHMILNYQEPFTHIFPQGTHYSIPQFIRIDHMAAGQNQGAWALTQAFRSHETNARIPVVGETRVKLAAILRPLYFDLGLFDSIKRSRDPVLQPLGRLLGELDEPLLVPEPDPDI